MPKTVPYWRWFTVDPERVGAKPTLSRHHMSEAIALERHPGATRHEPSKQMRKEYEPGEDVPSQYGPSGRR